MLDKELPAGPGLLRVKSVYWTYYAFLLWIPIETVYIIRDSEAAGGFTISRLLGVVLFALALLYRRICFKAFPAVFWMVFWYLAVYSLSVLWIPEELYAQFFVEQLTLLQMVVLFLISLNIFEDARFRGSVLRLYGWWSAIVAVSMMLGLFGGEFLRDTTRVSIFEQDPNVTAGFLALGAVCIVGNIRRFMSRTGALSVIAISLLIIAILQTGSRGGVAAFLAGVAGFGTCVGKKGRFFARAMFLSVVLGLFGYLVLQQFREGTVMASRLEQTWREGDTAGRTMIWETAWAMFLEKPFLGYGGYNNFVTLGARLNSFSIDTHNLFLAQLTEVGLIGAAPFILAFFYTLERAWRYGKNTGNALPFALMCSLSAINISLTGYDQKLFWIFFAAAAASALELDEMKRVRKAGRER